MAYSEYYKAINGMEELIKKDFFGPVFEDEVIEIEPISRYICGILYPQKTEKNISEEVVEEDTIEDVISDIDDSIINIARYKPSAMAITAMVSIDSKVLNISFKFARYICSKISKEYRDNKFTDVNSYTRKPYSFYTEINIPNEIGKFEVTLSEQLKAMNIVIELHVRKLLDNGDRLITVSVCNKKISPNKNTDQNINSLFQCELSISLKQDEFLPIYIGDRSINNEDILISNMQYSEIKNYSYGHGCATRNILDNGNVIKIKSEFIPTHEVLQMMPGKLKNNKFLQMTYLINSNKKDVIDELNEFIEEYTEWFSSQKVLGTERSDHSNAISLVFSRIEVCINRLKKGVLVLRDDEIAYQAFVHMNEAMQLQRVKSKNWNRDDIYWYPFQLAYILQIIPDVVYENSEYRDFVDLLWFPTGGGKTEAYLGVSAFVIFYRRLKHKMDNDGVAIIMRYTLRLLTIQQLERATSLICSCEYIRKKYNIFGGEINIGLWIGSSMTPNKIDEAKQQIKNARNNYSKDKKHNEKADFQLVEKCPWCGSTIDIGCYNIEQESMIISCKNNIKCEFHERLPIYLIDEDIYNKRPTLLLSTVDKFARIVWEEKTKRLFGDNKHLPPELIVQDELHLISGPLGSISGIYEIAIQKLCENNGKTPKIIASTATVRNATSQINNLYNRKMFQFPPSGISFNDSFFAKLADVEEKPARRYIGLCNFSGSMTDVFIKLYANLFLYKTILKKQNVSDDIIDQYYTNIGYFNSIKDLGSMSSVLEDRIIATIKSLTKHKFAHLQEEYKIENKDFYRFKDFDELTSRKNSKEIKKTLVKLDKKFGESGSCSYVLTSNMFSVGIDIDRLGVMSMYNQPKTNAEYIQATSRVGRSKPGVVFSLYNSSRSRDKSHYEQFEFYHRTFYQYVESTSVTPFSSRVLEKTLHAVFIALVRHKLDNLSSNSDARNFRADIEGVVEIKKFLLEQVKVHNEDAYTYAKDYLEFFINLWEKYAIENSNTFVYVDYNNGICLLNSGEMANKLPIPPTLNSLRNVEQNSNVYIARR